MWKRKRIMVETPFGMYLFLMLELVSIKAGEWKNLSRFIHVQKCTIKKEKETYGNRFYISDETTISERKIIRKDSPKIAFQKCLDYLRVGT
jgi:hypothetical protein